MKIARIAVSIAVALATHAFAADRLEAEGATSAYYMLKTHAAMLRETVGVDLVVAPVGTGRAMLDLIEGRTRMAVVTTPLSDAVEAARNVAWLERGRVLSSEKALTYTPLPTVDPSGRMLAVVTVGAPPPQLARVILALDPDDGMRIASATAR
jgi:hypothetical protein